MLYFIILLVLLSILFFYMYKEGLSDSVRHEELTFSHFPGSFGKIKIFFISDIHKRLISDSIINEVKGKADIVIIGGDLTEKKVSIDNVKYNLTKLKEIGPVYFVWGNNDYEVDTHVLDATLLYHGVKILDNTAVSFESREGDQFILLGIDDISRERDRLDLALHDAGKKGFRVLVSHDPKVVEQILPEMNISLVLSGHTHGGQIRLFGLGLYKLGGIRKIGETILFTSNGYGTTFLPLRLGAKAETHLITIKKN